MGALCAACTAGAPGCPSGAAALASAAAGGGGRRQDALCRPEAEHGGRLCQGAGGLEHGYRAAGSSDECTDARATGVISRIQARADIVCMVST
jgi:hypothetical protein